MSMYICKKCGREINNESNFCNYCGEPIEQKDEPSETKREQEYAGKVIKCPACGAELQSMVAICPSCGHEITQRRGSSSFKAFVDDIDKCDNDIVSESGFFRTGWHSWTTGEKFLFVAINIITLCIPIAIFLILPMFIKGSIVPLSYAEKRKVAVIENHSFSNDRESLVEALLFIKAKTSFLVEEGLNSKSLFWIRLWTKKAEQVYQKSEIVMDNDSIMQRTYEDILANKRIIKKKVKTKAIVGGIILVIACSFIAVKVIKDKLPDNSSIQSVSEIKNENSTYKWPKNGINTKLPKPEIEYGEISSHSKDYFSMSLYQATKKQYNSYVNQCIDSGFNVDYENDETGYTAYDKDGCKLIVTYSEDDNAISITLDGPIPMAEIVWPKHGFAKTLPAPKSDYGYFDNDSSTLLQVYIGNTTMSDYNEYVNACLESGYSEDYYKGDEYFSAEDSEGSQLTVKFEGNNTMHISVINLSK